MAEKLANMEEVDECMKDVPSCLDKLNELDKKIRIQAVLNNINPKIGTKNLVEIESNTNKDKFNFKINWKKLNILLNIEQLEQIWEALVLLLNKNIQSEQALGILVSLFNNDIQLFGDLWNRSIAKDSFMLDWFEERYIENSKTSLWKNDIEELFIIIMKAKWVPMDKWKIEKEVCHNGEVNDACRQALGNKKGA